MQALLIRSDKTISQHIENSRIISSMFAGSSNFMNAQPPMRTALTASKTVPG
jgi:hypothetical protein